MTWKPEVYMLGEARPWPDAVTVVMGVGGRMDYVRERTCRLVGTIYYDGEGIWYHELTCGHEVETLDREPPSYCQECGARVEP